MYTLSKVFDLREYVLMLMTSTKENIFFTAKLSKQGYRYHKLRKVFFSKFYHRHSEMILKYNTGLKTLLKQGISEPVFYGDFFYKS